MKTNYKPGDTAYIVENNMAIREVIVLKIAGEFCTLRFAGGCGGVRLRENRLFPTMEAAASIPEET